MTFFKNSNLLKNKKRQKVKMFKLFLLNPDKWTFFANLGLADTRDVASLREKRIGKCLPFFSLRIEC